MSWHWARRFPKGWDSHWVISLDWPPVGWDSRGKAKGLALRVNLGLLPGEALGEELGLDLGKALGDGHGLEPGYTLPLGGALGARVSL